MVKPLWYRVLEAARAIQGEITSRTLGLQARIDPSDASAWLCKFSKWGYARRLGTSSLGGKTIAYEITGFGHKAKPPRRSHYTSRSSE